MHKYRGFKRSKRKSSGRIRRETQNKTVSRLTNVRPGCCPEQGRTVGDPCNEPIWRPGRSDASGNYCRVHAPCFLSLPGGRRCDNLRVPVNGRFSRYCEDHADFSNSCALLDGNRRTSCHDVKPNTRCAAHDSWQLCRDRRGRLNDCLRSSQTYYNTCLHREVQNPGHTRFLDPADPASFVVRISECDRFCPPRPSVTPVGPDSDGFTTVRRRGGGGKTSIRSRRRAKSTGRLSSRRRPLRPS